MSKRKHFFRRSEYGIALDHYRKARRRGDAVEAQRWLKLADMHLRITDRFEAGVNLNMQRDARLRETRARAAERSGRG
jgi:hypothetical protein